MWMIWASTVSFPIRVDSNVKAPLVLIVPPITSSPGRFSTGIGSPEIIDSSTKLIPSVTVPSTGTFSPGRTRIWSPTTTSLTGTPVSEPSRMTVAVFGCRSMSLRMASDVFPFALASRYRPRVRKAASITAVS